ncbi:MAG: DUF1499 domain-containing protein [Aestuariivirgaceae bacterium]|nr:DUF1499 domain-containing protein [Aestuariivirgaceae bacterium]
MTLARAAILACLLGLGLLFAAREQIWVLLAGPADQGAVDFANITRSGKPNDYLLCPPDLCANADAQAPVFAASGETLLKATLALVAENVIGEEGFAFRYVTRTPLMRFPDTVSIRILELGETQATLGIYSRSLIGHSDLGANRARVETLIARLQKTLKPAPGP